MRLWKKKRQLLNSVNNIAFIGVSKWVTSILKQSYIRHKEIATIENGIDLESFTPGNSNYLFREYDIPKNKKIILAVANLWNKRKGIDTVLKLSKDLEEYHFFVVGKISKEYQNDLRSNNITHIDYVTDPRVFLTSIVAQI